MRQHQISKPHQNQVTYLSQMMMDSIEEISGNTTENNLEFSSSNGYQRKHKDFYISSQGSASHGEHQKDELEEDDYSPFKGVDPKLGQLQDESVVGEEIVTLSQQEIQRLKKFVFQQERKLKQSAGNEIKLSSNLDAPKYDWSGI